MVVNTLNLLGELGFSEYEARAYLSLLKENPVTAYEAAKNGGLPTAKIYQVLAKLMEKGVVLELAEAGKKRYVPMEPDEFMARQRMRFNANLSSLEGELEKERAGSPVSYIWNIKDREGFANQARMMIGRAESNILVSLWQEELSLLEGDLKKKADQGVALSVVLFGQGETSLTQLFRHPIGDTLQNEKGGRNFSLVYDSRQAMAATLFAEGKTEGAWSGNRGFVTVTEDYIKHDIYIMKIVERFNDDLLARFGEDYHLLRDVFHDREVNYGGN